MDTRGPHRKVIIVTDGGDATEELARAIAMGGFTPDIHAREEASEGDLDLPIRAAVLAISRIEGWRRLFHHWSGRGLEPLTCLLLAPVEGAAAIEEEALTLGYRHIVRASLHGNHEVDGHPRLAEALAYLQSHDYSLVPLIARELGGLDSECAHLLAAAFEDPPFRNVETWVERAGYRSEYMVNCDVMRFGLGGAKQALMGLKLLSAVYLAESTDLKMNDIAVAIGYSGARYLGRLARTRTLRSFRTLDLDTALRFFCSGS